jgi:hypothetical protein
MASFVFTSVLCVLHVAAAADPDPAPAVSGAQAQLPTIGVVGLHHPSLDPTAQKQAVSQLVSAIEASGKFDGVPTGEVRSGILGRESVILEEGLLSGPREKLTLGRTAYNQALWDEAIVQLTEAVNGFRATFRGANNSEDLWDAQVYLGSSHILKEKPNVAEAKAAFSAAVALSPAKPVNPALFPPNVVEVFEQVRTQLRATRATLQIVAGPGSSVWLDGVARGPSPVSVPEVVAGEHHVLARSATSDGYLKFTLGRAAPPPIDVPMGNPTFGSAAATPIGRSGQVAALYESLAARSGGIDYLLIGGSVDNKLQLQLFDARARTYSGTLVVPFVDDPTDEAVQALPNLVRGISADGSFATAAAAPPPLDVGANAELALLLTERVAPLPFTGAPAFPGARVATEPAEEKPERERKKVKAGTVLGVIVTTLVVGGGAAGGYYLLSREPTDPNQGTVIVQF